MQPIILLAIVGIAGGAMSVGFLGNTIELDVQQLGVGEATLETPIQDPVKETIQSNWGNYSFTRTRIKEVDNA